MVRFFDEAPTRLFPGHRHQEPHHKGIKRHIEMYRDMGRGLVILSSLSIVVILFVSIL